MTELEKIMSTFKLYYHNINDEDLKKFALKCYNLGKSSKKCKEDNDNPYNIDYKRQTKLFEDNDLGKV